jgi:L-fuconolactonase
MPGLYDTHAHIWTLDPERYPWRSILAQAKIPEYPFTAADLLSNMASAGVTRTLLIQPSTYGWDHRYLLEALEAHPESFRGVVLADPLDDGVARRLVELASARGVRGVRFHILDDAQERGFGRAAARVAQAALAANLVVTVQAGPGRLGPVAAMARAHPDLVIVVDHLGLVRWSGEGSTGLSDLLSLAGHPKVCIKLSGLEVLSGGKPPFEAAWPLVRTVVQTFGAARVMWGSNSPHALASGSYPELAGVPRLCLGDHSEADLRLITGGTAARVWGD